MKKTLLTLSFLAFSSSFLTLNAQNIYTICGNGVQGYSGDGGPATAAEIDLPYGILVDNQGNVDFADWNNHVLRKISTSGTVTTFAGNGVAGYTGDGGQASAAEIHSPYAITMDANGNIYINDEVDDAIREINTNGIINTIAGNGTPGYTGDGGPATAAEINNPHNGLHVDAAGNIYFCDFGNNVIRKITAAGIISTIAGNGSAGYNGDGSQATAAEMNSPAGLAMDAQGNIYISDQANNVIRKVSTTGIITTVVGNGTAGYGGDGGQATAAMINRPYGITMSGAGNLYIADGNNNVIREYNPTSGIITTIAGNGVQGYSGDGGPATAAEIYHPVDLVFSANSNVLYFDDDLNFRIRKIVLSTLGFQELENNASVKLYPNPNNGVFTIESSIVSHQPSVGTQNFVSVQIYNVLGEKVYSNPFSIEHSALNIDLSGQPSGIYLYRVISENRELVSEGKFIIEK